MREELRRRIPKTRGWYTGTILGILVIVGCIILLIWRSMQAESPQRVVEKALEAARADNVAGVRAVLTPTSMSEPAAETWLEQFSTVLARPEVEIRDVNLLRDAATVRIGVPHRSLAGGTETTEVGVRTLRVDNEWRIDLPSTMASANPQFWQALAAEGR